MPEKEGGFISKIAGLMGSIDIEKNEEVNY
jgi:hypothetical protein